MGQDGYFEKWASVILGLVSLLLGLHLAKIYVLPRLDSHPRISSRRPIAAVPRPAPLNSSKTKSDSPKLQAQHLKSRKESAKTVARRSSTSPREVSASQASSESTKVEPKRKLSAEAAPASSAPDADETPEVAKSMTGPLPPTRTFETIGYVEQPDGTRQAVVSKGDQVFVVHEGEIFDEHYRVLSITSSQVEAADLTVPQLAPATAPEPTVLARQSTSPAPSREAETSTPALAEAKPLGFVERPGPGELLEKMIGQQ